MSRAGTSFLHSDLTKAQNSKVPAGAESANAVDVIERWSGTLGPYLAATANRLPVACVTLCREELCIDITEGHL